MKQRGNQEYDTHDRGTAGFPYRWWVVNRFGGMVFGVNALDSRVQHAGDSDLEVKFTTLNCVYES